MEGKAPDLPQRRLDPGPAAPSKMRREKQRFSPITTSNKYLLSFWGDKWPRSHWPDLLFPPSTNNLMKHFITLLILLSGLSLLAGPALPPWQEAPLIDHLNEVNPRWALVSEAEDLCLPVAFLSDQARIQWHLQVVENWLRQHTDPAEGDRLALIDRLSQYREAGIFPQNTYSDQRHPYFIDEVGTACAVGHLLIESGEQALAQQIAREHNGAYLMELLDRAALVHWAGEAGFTSEELALIQPGYVPTTTWTSLGEGADGAVTTLFHDEANDRLLLGGAFNTLQGVAAPQVAAYDGQQVSALGDGVAGEIKAMAVFQGQVVLGGAFAGDNNLAWLDGNSWTYSQIAPGAVHALQVYGDYLYAGGTFTEDQVPLNTPGALHFFAKYDGQQWTRAGYFRGPVYALAAHQGDLTVGGDLLPDAGVPYYVARSFDSTDFYPASTSQDRLDAPVKALTSDGTFLYAAGDAFDDEGGPLFGLARLGNSGWQYLLNHQNEGLQPNATFRSLATYRGAVIVGGYFIKEPFVGTFGSHVASVHANFPSEPYLTPMAAADSGVYALAAFDNYLYMGGDFVSNFSVSLNHIAKTLNTAVSREAAASSLALGPLPLTDRAVGQAPQRITRLRAYALDGREVALDYQLSGDRFEIHRGRLSSGIYLLQVWAEGELLMQGKLPVQ